MPAHISIIISCYNTKPEFIQEAIDSVKKHKGKYVYNIIVVDDGSTDESTLYYLRNISDNTIQIITQENRGLAGARNTGVRHSDTNHFLFLDSDDRIKPNYIEEGMNILTADKQIGVVYADAEIFGDGSRSKFEVGVVLSKVNYSW